jgi:WD40 repeat protein
MRRSFAFVLFFVLALSDLSCGGGSDGSPTAPSGAFEGTFVLETVNGTMEGQPITLVPPAITGSVVFSPDGRFAGTLSAPAFEIAESASGSYTVTNSSLTLNYDDGTVEVWTLSEDRNRMSGNFTEEGVDLAVTWVRGSP